MKNVFIIGSKGIPARYGGFETAVENITARNVNEGIRYHVACLAKDNNEFIYNNARCFNVKVGNIGNVKALVYDALSLARCFRYIKKNKPEDCCIYILACRIGPLLALFKGRLKKADVKVFVNPDGHEWKRSKWKAPIKAYWKISEKLMVKYSDLVVCDSKAIQDYIKKEYALYNPQTRFIPYGADTIPSKITDNSERLLQWYAQNSIEKGQYYLAVGRFVPENNYETIIKEFMASDTLKKLVIITNVEKNGFYDKLSRNTKFEKDKRIVFAGTLYDSELLKKARENAFAYIHGHEVGGTNPSLLEALASTKINILFDVVFNREVAEDCALYFRKCSSSLREAIEKADKLDEEEIGGLAQKSKDRVKEAYSWDIIISEYEAVFLNAHKESIEPEDTKSLEHEFKYALK